MQLAVLRAFLAVVEEGSVSRAALRLHLGQSSLTRQIAALEQEVGTPLFERTARGVIPTAAGQTFANKISKPLSALEGAILSSRRFGGGQRVELRIGYLQSLARSYLNPALAALRAAQPHIKVKLVDSCAGGQMRALRAGEIDVALIGQEGRLLSREFYSRNLRSLNVGVALPEDHPLTSRGELRLADLRKETFIGKDETESPGFNQWIVQMCRRSGFRPRFVQHAESISEMLSLAVSEGAVALLPEFAAERPAPSVVMRTLRDSWARWDLLVVWQRGRVAAPVRCFLDALSVASGPVELRKSA